MERGSKSWEFNNTVLAQLERHVRLFQIIRRMCLHILIVGIIAQPDGDAQAQNHSDPTASSRYTFVLVHVPLTQALNELIDKTEIDIFYESELISNKTAYCNIENATAKEALSCILESARLDFYQQSSGLYVITRTRRDAPQLGSITGIVIDKNTREPLPYASIFLEEASTGAATNLEGRFAFSRLKPGSYRVFASHVAYEDRADSIYIDPDSRQRLEIGLTPRTLMTTPIVVNGLHQRLPSEQLTAFRVTSRELQNAPASSTPSTLQALDAVVGVHVGDALADVHVQGGDSGEHQYLLDDVPIFVPIRNGGFFGSFSPFAIDQISIHKAGYEARHGSFLSGSIELNHDLQASDGSIATIQIDPLSLNGKINGAIREEKNISAQWMVAGRMGLWEIFRPHQIEQSVREWSRPNSFLSNALTGQENISPSASANLADSLLDIVFSDIHAATRIRFGDAQSVYASLYSGNNEFGIGTIPFDQSLLADEEFDRPAEAYTWSNRMSQIRYEWIQGDRTFFKVGVWSSNYRLRHPFVDSPFLADDRESVGSNAELSDDFNEIKEFGIQAGVDWAPGSHHVISGNIEFIDTESEFKLSIDPFADSLSINDKTFRPLKWRLQSFIEDAFSLNERTRITLGSRFTFIPIQERLYAEPRFSIRHDLANKSSATWAVQLAAGLYRQFYNQFDVASHNSAAILPSFRFWIPVNKETRASSAYHTAVSLLFIPDEKWQFNLEGYYKYNPALTVLDFTSRLTSNTATDRTSSFLKSARGYAYGAGISAVYHLAILNFKTTYEYAISRRQLSGRFDGRFVPVPWETPHQFYAVVDFTLLDRLTLTLRWQGLLGRTWGYRRAYYDYLEPDPTITGLEAYNLSQPQQHKLPAYTQWDFGIAYGHRIGKASLQGRLNFVNLLDKSNVIDWVLVTNELGEVSRQSRTTTPFFPSMSLRVTY